MRKEGRKELVACYEGLKGKVDRFLQGKCREMGMVDRDSENVECFMKLATRSPKDLGYKYSAHEIDQAALALTLYLKQNHNI